MAKKQKWHILGADGTEHVLTYTYSAFRREVTLTIDGECFLLPKGERQEPFRLGDEQAMLIIHRSGRAAIRTREGEAQEIKI